MRAWGGGFTPPLAPFRGGATSSVFYRVAPPPVAPPKHPSACLYKLPFRLDGNRAHNSDKSPLTAILEATKHHPH